MVEMEPMAGLAVLLVRVLVRMYLVAVMVERLGLVVVVVAEKLLIPRMVTTVELVVRLRVGPEEREEAVQMVEQVGML